MVDQPYSICPQKDDSGGSLGMSLCGPYDIMSYSYAMTVVVLLISEKGLSYFEKNSQGTPYQGMVVKIFKEFTAQGFNAFIIQLLGVRRADTIPGEWNDCISHADLVLFVMTFWYIFQLSYYMKRSDMQARRWRLAREKSVGYLLENFYEDEHSGVNYYLPFSIVRDQLEFKILQTLFCNQYSIIKSDLDFSSYLITCFQQYLVSLLAERVITWAFFLALVAINVIRLKITSKVTSINCMVDDEACMATYQLILFSLCGWILVAFLLFIYIISRVYQIRLICKADVCSISEYRPFLCKEEKKDLGKIIFKRSHGYVDTDDNLSLKDLKNTLQKMKQKNDDIKEGISINSESESESDDSDEEINSADNNDNNNNNSAIKKRFSILETFSGIKRASFQKAKHKLLDQQSFNAMLDTNRATKTLSALNSSSKLTNGSNNRRYSTKINLNVKRDAQKINKDLFSIFYFGKPEYYFLTIQFALMLNCLYGAMWFCNYIHLPLYANNLIMWYIITICPIAIMIPLFGYILMCASTLLAVSTLSANAVEKIVEEQLVIEKTVKLVRTHILRKLKKKMTYNDPLVRKQQIINLMSNYGDSKVKKSSFKKLLDDMHIYLIPKRFDQLFNLINIDYSVGVDPIEFWGFIYPDEAKLYLDDIRIREALTLATSTQYRKKSISLTSKIYFYGDNKEQLDVLAENGNNSSSNSSSSSESEKSKDRISDLSESEDNNKNNKKKDSDDEIDQDEITDYNINQIKNSNDYDLISIDSNNDSSDVYIENTSNSTEIPKGNNTVILLQSITNSSQSFELNSQFLSKDYDKNTNNNNFKLSIKDIFKIEEEINSKLTQEEKDINNEHMNDIFDLIYDD